MMDNSLAEWLIIFSEQGRYDADTVDTCFRWKFGLH